MATTRHLILGLLLLSGCLAASGDGKKYKFLVFSPRFATSHVNFLGKVSDTLAEAGHDVVVISPIFDPAVGSAGVKKARVIEIPQTEAMADANVVLRQTVDIVWEKLSALRIMDSLKNWDKLTSAWARACGDLVHHPGLLERLRAEKFDAAYSEPLDFCGFGLFHYLGIEKVAVMNSLPTMEGRYYLTQAPVIPSYIPGMNAMSDKMTFLQRVANFLILFLASGTLDGNAAHAQKVFETLQPGFPLLKEIAANSSLVFLNSEPLVDFPRLTNHRMIDIRGITMDQKHAKLNQTWSDIMDLRPQTVLLSFGSFAKSYLMREEFKQNIRETLRKFPDVTFIWKYEKPEDGISAGIANIVESTWVPQVDLLHDPRLSAFITHCGIGSTTEANTAGVPLLVIPLAADQLWNAQVVKRAEIGVVVPDKEALGKEGILEEAIRQLLGNEKYTENAAKLSRMIRDRPFAMKEILVRNMEFLAEYGPLRMLDHEGRNLNFFQFYLIDVIAFLTAIVLVVVTLIVILFKCVVSRIVQKCTRKTKTE